MQMDSYKNMLNLLLECNENIFTWLMDTWFHEIRYGDIRLKTTWFADSLLSNSYYYDYEILCITWPHIDWIFRIGLTPCFEMK